MSSGLLGVVTLLTIKLMDLSGHSVSGCFVQIGTAPGVPFTNNSAYSDENGLVVFEHNEDLKNEPITAVCPGRPHVTYFKQSGSIFMLQVPEEVFPQLSNVSSQFNGWVNPGGGNWADFGIFIPNISPKKLLRIQMSDLISSKMESVTVFGKKINVPTNVSLPKQKLKYGLISINLEKPKVSLDVASPGNYSFMGLTGNFPFEKVVNQVLGSSGEIFDYLNDMNFYSISQGPTINVSQSQTHPDMVIDKNTLKDCFSFTAANSPNNLKVVGISLFQNINLKDAPFSVTDLKSLTTTPTKLKCTANNLPLSAAALSIDKQTLGFSGIVARQISSNMAFDSFYNIPQVTVSQGGLSLRSTRPERSIKQGALGYMAILSDVGDDRLIPKWVVMSQALPDGTSQASFTLPQLPKFFLNNGIAKSTVKQRWEWTWFGIDPKYSSFLPSNPNVDFNLLEIATHAARMSLDF